MVSLSNKDILTIVIDMSDWDGATTIIGRSDEKGKLLKAICDERQLTFETRYKKAEAHHSNPFGKLFASFTLCSRNRKGDVEYKLFKASLTEILTYCFFSPLKSLNQNNANTQISFIYNSNSGWLATDSIFYSRFEPFTISPISLAREAKNFVFILTRIQFILLRTS